MATRHYIENPNNYSYAEIVERAKNGGHFVVYQYTISLLAITLRRLTSVHFIDKEEAKSKYASTANIISAILGWWAIPFGPVRTIQSFALNKKGGVVVTQDILLNLKEEDFNKGIVIIEEIYSPFHTLNKTEEKYLRKSLEKFMELSPGLREAYFALYVNVPDGVEPYFVIGLPEDFLGTERIFYEDQVRELKKILHKYFQKNATFEFISLKPGDTLSERLIEMGLVVRRV